MLVAQFDWEIEQLNVKTTFLNLSLYKKVYMEQPEDFEILSMSGRKLVC
jgi:hypothetical protein